MRGSDSERHDCTHKEVNVINAHIVAKNHVLEGLNDQLEKLHRNGLVEQQMDEIPKEFGSV